MKRGISKSLAQNKVFAFNIIIGKDDYRISGFSLERNATNEEMLHLTKDTLRIFQEIEQKITDRKKSDLSPEDKLFLTPEECQAYLTKLAGCGRDAYEQFFFDKYAKSELTKLRSYQSKMQFAPTIYSDSLIYPWEVLYEGDDYKNPKVDMFWGFHYPVSRALTNKPPTERKYLLSLEMLFCLHQTLNFVHQQEQPAIEKLIIKHKGNFSLLKVSRKIQKLQDGEELLAHFYQNQYNILHFACHCRQYKDDVDALIISLQEDDNNTQQIELEVKNFNRVNGVFLTQPLIFLNACQSAGGVDELRKTFNLPNKFIQYGAAAVIATACPMPDVFAAAFAKVFYEFFIGKKMLIGKALCETRRYFLENYNNRGDCTNHKPALK
ncbi:CHAT domain-containing protein, partial [Brunnivagina elsteri]